MGSWMDHARNWRERLCRSCPLSWSCLLKMRRKLIFIFFVSLTIVGCWEGDTKTNAVRNRISGDIHRELHAGSSREDVEKFFARHKMTYAFDESNHRFESDTKTADLQSILVLIY